MLDLDAIEARAEYKLAHLEGQGISLRDITWTLQDVLNLVAELHAATRYLGQALTCAIYGLDEMNWKDVEDWLRRDEPEQHDL